MTALALRPRQLAVWLLLAALVIGVVLIERETFFGAGTETGADEKGATQAAMLLPVPLAELAVIEIADDGKVHRFERDHHGDWIYGEHEHDHEHNDGHHGQAGQKDGSEHEHDIDDPEHHHHQDPADHDRIEAAFGGLSRARIERQLEPGRNLGDYGVEKPDILINLYTDDDLQPLVRYAVGDVAPDTVSRYVMAIDSSAVMTIPDYHIENLLTLIDALAVEP